MPRRAKGPRLWWRPARRDATGNLTHAGAWFVLDGTVQRSTRLGVDATAEQREAALTAYLVEKNAGGRNLGKRDPSQIPITDVLTLYATDVVETGHTDPSKTASRLAFLRAYWQDMTLDQVTGAECRAYARHRGSDAAARRELEDFRAAINYHRKEGLHDRIVSVVLPDRSPPRERWLTRAEAAHLIGTTWRHIGGNGGQGASRRNRQHVARFMILARYMGSRATVLATASIEPKRPKAGPWIDLENGMFYGRADGERVTNKRKQTVAVPRSLLAHLRRWQRRGQRYAVEWNGKPVTSIKKAHMAAVADAKLDGVTQHTWRHTVATWLMQAGADSWMAADFLAIDVKTLQRVYGHHHPAHTAGVHAAFDAHRQRYANAIREQKAIPANSNQPEKPAKPASRA